MYNACIKSAFGFAPMIWMFCQKTSYKKIESAQKRVYLEHDKSLNETLDIYGEKSIHNMHSCSLANELFKVSLSLSPSFISTLFVKKETLFIYINII